MCDMHFRSPLQRRKNLLPVIRFIYHPQSCKHERQWLIAFIVLSLRRRPYHPPHIFSSSSALVSYYTYGANDVPWVYIGLPHGSGEELNFHLLRSFRGSIAVIKEIFAQGLFPPKFDSHDGRVAPSLVCLGCHDAMPGLGIVDISMMRVFKNDLLMLYPHHQTSSLGFLYV